MKQTADSQLHIPEILAPAGTEEAMRAAVNAGCDAVYLGGTLFSARAFAGNFDQEAIIRTLDYCHLFGVKIYMTVNTLLKEDEIGALAAYMRPFYRAGLDGVIVQDVGVIRVLKREYPDLPLHGSTQMSIASVYGAAFLKNCGLRRVVPARELTLEEIRTIRSQVDIEIETFVHGAMCYAYSGKCLFSSFLGGRSGNRGRCAQPCRQLYEIGGRNNWETGGRNDGESGSRKGSREYAMSMKDMCTLTVLPDLIEAGIDSFKIEGRMKNPYYVAATVDAYRQARDKYLALKPVDEEAGRLQPAKEPSWIREYQEFVRPLTEQMQDIYNRGGFCTGYYFTEASGGNGSKEASGSNGSKEASGSNGPKQAASGSNGPKQTSGGRFSVEKGLHMIARTRPNHTGLPVGIVEKTKGPDVSIKTQHKINRQDVLEIEGTGIELTSNSEAQKGAVLVLKGKELKKIRPGMQVFRTRNNSLLEEIEEHILHTEKKIQVQAQLTARLGEPLRITLFSEETGVCITEEGNPVEAASSKPSDPETLIGKMQKTGGTNVELTVSCQLDDNIFIPMSELNSLRRKAVDTFKQAAAETYHRSI